MRALLVLFALLPAWGIAYLAIKGDTAAMMPELFAPDLFAIGACLVSINGLFMTVVTGQCYREKGEPFLKWLMLGFFSFGLLYAPQGLIGIWNHGVMPGHTLWGEQLDTRFFLLYGPASRLAIAGCLFVGLWYFGVSGLRQKAKDWQRLWWRFGLAVCAALVLMGAIANGWQDVERFRAILDTAAALVALAGLIPIVRLKLHASLIMLYAVSLVWLAQASVAFLLSNPWDDLWWYGHFVSTGGIFILGYGAVNAFHALRLYDGVYSQDEILARLNEEKGKAEEALLQLRIANEELSRLATTDSLTGVSNRRQFMTTLGLEIARSKRTGAPLSLLMLDIDRFKLVNDTYGHPAGDKVLQAFAKVMLDSLRLLDHVGRLGGEEFAVLLPDTGYAVAYGVAERLREACAACVVIDDEGHEIRFTTSIGIAQFGRDGEMADQLISAADTRLYKAKHAGRNRVEA